MPGAASTQFAVPAGSVSTPKSFAAYNAPVASSRTRSVTGRSPISYERSAQVELNVNYFKRIRDNATLDVVGEAYRQAGVLAARPPTGDDLPPGLPAPPPGYYKALLVPEPTNQYDRNAIRVALWAGGSWSMANLQHHS